MKRYIRNQVKGNLGIRYYYDYTSFYENFTFFTDGEFIIYDELKFIKEEMFEKITSL